MQMVMAARRLWMGCQQRMGRPWSATSGLLSTWQLGCCVPLRGPPWACMPGVQEAHRQSSPMPLGSALAACRYASILLWFCTKHSFSLCLPHN